MSTPSLTSTSVATETACAHSDANIGWEEEREKELLTFFSLDAATARQQAAVGGREGGREGGRALN